jgi:DDE superfamily endonuclease
LLRRDGAPFRPSSGALLRTARADASGLWNGPALSLQHDLFHHQSGAVGLHDFPTAFYGAGVSEFSWLSAAPDVEDQEKVFLVVDGHPVHQARSVTRWLDEHREQIRVFFLPSYSPELNPDELLNQDVKTNAVGRVRPVNVQEMMDNVRSYLRITQARPTVVKNYFCERHVRYAAS